jgi:hypothetical protein
MEKKKVRKKKSQKKQGRSAAEVRSYCVVFKDKYGKQGAPPDRMGRGGELTPCPWHTQYQVGSSMLQNSQLA